MAVRRPPEPGFERIVTTGLSVRRFNHPESVLEDGEGMRNLLQIGVYLGASTLGYWLGHGDAYHALAIAAGMLVGLILAGWIGRSPELSETG